MNNQNKNIIIVANDQRYDYLRELINMPNKGMSLLTKKQLFEDRYFDIPPDIVIIDTLLFDNENLRILLIKHSSELLRKVPFILIFPTAKKLDMETDFFNSPFNFFLNEPLDQQIFRTMITAALHIGRLEQKVDMERGLEEGEKQLISSINQIIDINKIRGIENDSGFRSYLQFEFSKQMEIVSNAGGAFFGFFEDSWKVIKLSTFDNPPKNIEIEIKDEELINQLKEKIEIVINTHSRENQIVSEIELKLGVELSSLMLVPLSIFNKPYGCLILLNKVTQNNFVNNDIIFASLALHKISYYLEQKFIKDIDQYDENDPLLKFLLPEKRILDERKLYKQMLSSVDFGVTVFDAAYNLVYINNAALRLLGMVENDEKKELLSDYFLRKDFEEFKRIFEKSDFPIVRKEILLSNRNDPNYFIGFSIYKVEEKTKPKFIMVFSEISDSKKIQTEIVRMDRMVSLGILSSGIAHEIRNPLAGMKAMSETLRAELDPESNHIEYVDRILRQINRLDDLLKSFFSYANPLRPDPTVVHMRNIFKEVLPLLNRKLRDEGITISQNYEKDLYRVFVDASQIEQVLFNLLLNAIDAMSGGGILTIEVKNSDGFIPIIDRRRNLNNALSDRFIEIKISDTGKGIPENIQDRIFSPFFTTKTNGTGLGLAIVYKIVQNHGGKIELCSGDHEGTQFCIYLPAHDDDKDQIFIE
jgi:signal transduction histidine kinase